MELDDLIDEFENNHSSPESKGSWYPNIQKNTILVPRIEMVLLQDGMIGELPEKHRLSKRRPMYLHLKPKNPLQVMNGIVQTKTTLAHSDLPHLLKLLLVQTVL
jgi:hypothetical protein